MAEMALTWPLPTRRTAAGAFGPIVVAMAMGRRRCACWDGFRVGGRVWAAKRHLSPAYEGACNRNK